MLKSNIQVGHSCIFLSGSLFSFYWCAFGHPVKCFGICCAVHCLLDALQLICRQLLLGFVIVVALPGLFTIDVLFIVSVALMSMYCNLSMFLSFHLSVLRAFMFFTMLHGMQTQSSVENSLCLSVWPSVKCVICDKTKERCEWHNSPYFAFFHQIRLLCWPITS